MNPRACGYYNNHVGIPQISFKQFLNLLSKVNYILTVIKDTITFDCSCLVIVPLESCTCFGMPSPNRDYLP